MSKSCTIGVIAFSLLIAAASFGAEYVLQWDNDVQRYNLCYGNGDNTWAAIDFDTSTLKSATTWRLAEVRAKMGTGLNERWDGMRLAVFDMAGGKPGKIIWPENGKPRFVVGSGTGSRYPGTWCNFPVGFNLLNAKFVVALEQHYDIPSCDSYAVGFGHGGAERHAWHNYRNAGWETTGLIWMIRAVVRSTNNAVEPTSIGRVKALYR